MGKLTGNNITGSVGAVVLKIVEGKTRVSAKQQKGTMKHTAATKSSGNTFGMAASLSKSIRAALVYQINGLIDLKMPSRMVSLLSETLFDCRDSDTKLFSFEPDSFQVLQGMEFNVKSRLAKSLLKRPKVEVIDNSLKVNIKASILDKDLKFPGKTFYCKIMVSLSLFRLSEGLAVLKSDTQEIMVGRDQPDLPEQELNFNLPAGCLCIATVFMQFFNHAEEGGLSFNNKYFNPGKVIKAVVTPGIYADQDDRTWIDMTVFPE